MKHQKSDFRRNHQTKREEKSVFIEMKSERKIETKSRTPIVFGGSCLPLSYMKDSITSQQQQQQ